MRRLTTIFIVVAFGCAAPEYPEPTPAVEAASSSANVKIIHASPDAPTLNFFVNNTLLGNALSNGQSFSAYSQSPVGQASMMAEAVNGKIGGTLDTSPILFRTGVTNQNNFTFADDAFYTFIVTDSIHRPKPSTLNATNPGGPQFLVLTDDLTAPNVGQSKIRFMNLAPGAPPVFVTRSSGNIIFPSVEYRAATPAFNTILSGTSNIQVRLNSASGTIIARILNFDLVSGKIYTFYLTGQQTGIFVKVPYQLNVSIHN